MRYNAVDVDCITQFSLLPDQGIAKGDRKNSRNLIIDHDFPLPQFFNLLRNDATVKTLPMFVEHLFLQRDGVVVKFKNGVNIGHRAIDHRHMGGFKGTR
jgi:hypothetical protein